MKKLLLAALFTGAVVSASAQGTLNFANSTGTRLTNNAGASFPAAGNSTYKAGIYWGPQGTAEGSLALLPAGSNGVTTTWGPLSGIFSGGTATFPVAGGTPIAVQIRVWTATYNDYAAALAGQPTHPTEALGKGVLQTLVLGAVGDPPSAPQDLAAPSGGGTPFQRFGVLTPVPEPSSIALGLLGLGAIALFRRRK
jgi:MYXO-CTERM domain-containing protein